MAHSLLKISIKNPCDENWNAMTPAGFNQRHCASCEKNVIDFTHMTDREIHRFIRENNGKICGRWRVDQLNRPIIEQARPASWWQVAASVGALMLASAGLQAQRSNMAPCSLAEAQIEMSVSKEGQSRDEQNTSTQPLKIFGNVFDEEGNPLIGAYIQLVGTNTGTASDFEGYYELEVPRLGGKLIISYVGYDEQEVVIETPLPGEQILGMNFVLKAGAE
ncbi:MAG: carboxypeptidase-like regulatory domain-containing protein, partial [Bacteroidota bacterium]